MWFFNTADRLGGGTLIRPIDISSREGVLSIRPAKGRFFDLFWLLVYRTTCDESNFKNRLGEGSFNKADRLGGGFFQYGRSSREKGTSHLPWKKKKNN